MNEESQKSRAFRKKYVVVNDRMQQGYRYELSAPMGRNFDPDFQTGTDAQTNVGTRRVLRQIHYNSQKEFPSSWFKNAKLFTLWPGLFTQLLWR